MTCPSHTARAQRSASVLIINAHSAAPAPGRPTWSRRGADTAPPRQDAKIPFPYATRQHQPQAKQQLEALKHHYGHPARQAPQFRPQLRQDDFYAYGTQAPYPRRYSDKDGNGFYDDGYGNRRGRHGGIAARLVFFDATEISSWPGVNGVLYF